MENTGKAGKTSESTPTKKPPPPPPSSQNTTTNEGSSTKRRGGSVKRKNTNPSSAGPSKRLARERLNHLPPLPSNNTPIKTRQSPLRSSSSTLSSNNHRRSSTNNVSLLPPPKPTLPVETPVKEPSEPVQSLASVLASWELGDEILADQNAHIVPNSAGWFSWKKIHSLEEKSLPSFFNGKCETQNPEMYLEIRNTIMKRFHTSPNKLISLSDVSDIVSAESNDAVQRILEFLDHWGLINFCPFKDSQHESGSINDKLNHLELNEAVEKKENADTSSTLLENLYSFKKIDNRHLSKPSKIAVSRALAASVLAEPAMSETLMGPQGPAVEYHCNFCSADCSSKRYHCQKQADFDLCTDCYNAERFGTGMVSTDFLLMEPVRIGVNGASWTDEETLLLLEALELYGNNWNEIAEHVATKSKAQCILHFIRLPIEDPFFEDNAVPDVTAQSNLEENTSKGSAPAAPQSASDSPVTVSCSTEEQTAAAMDMIDKEKNENGSEDGPQIFEDDALKALKKAFHAFGSLADSETSISLSEAGNPVMVLAAFLAGIVDPLVASCSSKSALRILCEKKSSLDIASKHCFQLEDPPAEENGLTKRTDTDKMEEIPSLQVEVSEQPMPSETDNSILPVVPKSPVRMETVSTEETKLKNNDLTVSKENPGTGDLKESETVGKAKDLEDGPDKQDLICSGKLVEGNDKKEDLDKVVDSNPTEQAKVQDENKPSDVSVEGVNSDMNKKTDDGKELLEKQAEIEDSCKLEKLKRAAVTVLSSASVKAKVLADQEEECIQKLAADIIDNQLRKLEFKMRSLHQLESAYSKQREFIERTRRRLLYERTQTIVSRLASPATLPRPISVTPFASVPALVPGQSFMGGVSRPYKPGTTKPPMFPSSMHSFRRVTSTDNNTPQTSTANISSSGLSNSTVPQLESYHTSGTYPYSHKK